MFIKSDLSDTWVNSRYITSLEISHEPGWEGMSPQQHREAASTVASPITFIPGLDADRAVPDSSIQNDWPEGPQNPEKPMGQYLVYAYLNTDDQVPITAAQDRQEALAVVKRLIQIIEDH